MSLEIVRIGFGILLHHLPLCSHMPDRPSSRTQNIPKCQFLVSVPYSALLPLMKDFVSNSPTSWRPKPETALDNTISLRALKKRTPILHKFSTFQPLKNLGNDFLNQALFGSHTR